MIWEENSPFCNICIKTWDPNSGSRILMLEMDRHVELLNGQSFII